MTDEQFKQLMDKLDEIARQRRAPTYIGYPVPLLPAAPGYPAPQPWQPYDGFPPHWRGGAVD